MKVLMVSKALVVGAYHKKIEELASLRVNLHLIVPPAWENRGLEIVSGNGYRVYPLKIVFSGYNHFHLYSGLSVIIENVKPDIVHIDEEHYSAVTFQTMRLAKKTGAKTLFFTWQNIYKDYPFPFSWIESYNLKNANAAIAGNEEAREIIRKKGFNKNIEVIPQFGVDPHVFRKQDSEELRCRLGIKKGTFVIGYMGRLVKEKGILYLIAALAGLKHDCSALIVGSGPSKSEILKKSRSLGIEQKVRIIEQVPSIRVPEYLNCFDCLVLPSLTRSNWKEQFGRVLIEAMACEIPVIGSNSGEIPNVIWDAGLIFQEGDVDDLKRKLKLLINNIELRNELSKKGLERVHNRYTQRKIAESTYNFYKRLMCSEIS